MPPVAEVDPAQRRIGLERTTAAALAVAGTLAVSTSEAVADSPNRVEIEKQALAAFGSTALTRTIDSEPIASDSANETLVPGPDGLVDADASQATASDLQQDCVRAALRKPKVWNPNLGYGYMVYPGDRRRQTTHSFVRITPTSEACRQVVTRHAPKVLYKVQNPNNHKKWTKTKPQTLEINDINASGGYRPMEADEGGIGAAGFGGYGVKNKALRYRCTPGKGVTNVQAVYQMKVASAIDGRTLGRKSYTVPVKIKPVQGVVLGGGVKRAC